MNTPLRHAFHLQLLVSAVNGLRAGILRLLQLFAACALGAGPDHLALLALAAALGLAGAYLLGRRLDTRRLAPFLLWPALLSNGLLIAVAAVDSLPAFLLLTVLHCCCDALLLPGRGSLHAQLFPQRVRGRLLGGARALFMACGLASAVLAGGWVESDTWRWLIPAAGVLGLLVSLLEQRLCRRAPRAGERRRPVPLPNAAGAIATPRFTAFLAWVSLAELAQLMLLPLLPAELATLGVSGSQLSWALVILPGLAACLGMGLWGPCIDRLGLLPVRAMAAVCCAADVLVLAMLPVAGSATITLLMLAGSLRGFGLGAGILCWNLAPLRFATAGNSARCVAVNSLVTAVRMLAAPVIGLALLSLLPMTGLLFVSAGISLCSAVALLALHRRPRRRPADRLTLRVPVPATSAA